MSDLSSIDITSASLEAADLREALSRRYTDAVRVLLLSSGNWAICGMATGKIQIAPALSDELLRVAAERNRADYEEFCESYTRSQEEKWKPLREGRISPEAKAKRPSPSAKPSPVSFEDLFGPKGGQKGP